MEVKACRVGTIIPLKCWGPWPSCVGRGVLWGTGSAAVLWGQVRREGGRHPIFLGPSLWARHPAKDLQFVSFPPSMDGEAGPREVIGLAKVTQLLSGGAHTPVPVLLTQRQSGERTRKPTSFPECLKLSSKSKSVQHPHFKRQSGTRPPGSPSGFPRLAPALWSSVFCHRYTHWQGLAGAPSWPGQDSKWLTKGLSQKRRRPHGETPRSCCRKGCGPSLPRTQS